MSSVLHAPTTRTFARIPASASLGRAAHLTGNSDATGNGTGPDFPDPPIWLRYPAVLLTALVVGTTLALTAHSVVLVGLIPALACAGVRRARRAALRRQAIAQRAAVVALCTALRAELEGGALPHGALLEAVWCRPELQDLADQLSTPTRTSLITTFGPTTADYLAAAAAVPGRGGLSGLAACWRATEEHGLPLAGAVAGIENALRAEEQRQLVLDAELSGIRLTMGLLAVLPVFGLLLGSSLGVRPWQILLQTFAGQVCLVIGCALELLGLWWADRLVASVADFTITRRPRPIRLRERRSRRTSCIDLGPGRS